MRAMWSYPRAPGIHFVALALVFAAGVAVLAQPGGRQQSGGSGTSATGGLAISADLDARLAKFRRVEMPFHSDGLSPRERQMVGKLVEASQYLEDIYWRQSDPAGLALLRSLEGSTKPQDVALRRSEEHT